MCLRLPNQNVIWTQLYGSEAIVLDLSLSHHPQRPHSQLEAKRRPKSRFPNSQSISLFTIFPVLYILLPSWSFPMGNLNWFSHKPCSSVRNRKMIGSIGFVLWIDMETPDREEKKKTPVSTCRYYICSLASWNGTDSWNHKLLLKEQTSYV